MQNVEGYAGSAGTEPHARETGLMVAARLAKGGRRLSFCYLLQRVCGHRLTRRKWLKRFFCRPPPAPRHGALLVRLAGAIDAALRARPPCTALGDAGIVLPDRDDTFYVADIALTCDPLRSDDQLIRNPILVVEILSPSTPNFDRNTKVTDYRRIPSV